MPMPISSQIKAGREGVGLFENALSMLTSAAGEPAAGMVALAELIRGGDSGAARDAVRQAFAYQPRTDAGQRQQRMLGELAASAMNSAPVRTWQQGVDIAGRYSPAAGAALQTIPTAIGVATGAKPAMQQGRALSELAGLAQNRMVQNAMTPRTLHPQSGVVMFRGGNPKGEAITWYASNKSLADDYAKYRGMPVHEFDVNISSPFNAGRTTNEFTPREFAIRALTQSGYKGKNAMDMINNFSDVFKGGKMKVTDFWSDPESAAKTREFLKSVGFDAINIDEDGVMTTAVFNDS